MMMRNIPTIALPHGLFDSDSREDSSIGSEIGHANGVPRNRLRSRHRKSNGFTVVELLIVLAVILTISAMAVPKLLAAIETARIARAIADIHTIEINIDIFQSSNNGELPDDLSQIGNATTLDPWGHPYQYLNHSTMKGNGKARKDRFLVPLNSDYDLYSVGPDGKSSPPITAKGSLDDIIRANNGSYVGLASEF